MNVPSIRIPRLTIVQLMKLVAYCASGMAVVGPMVRLQEATGGPMGPVLLFSAVCVPMVWAGLSFVLLRSGPSRDRFILACLIVAIVPALAFGLWILWMIGNSFRGGWEGASGFAITLGVVLLLLVALAFLANRLLGRPRPRSQAPALPPGDA